MKKIYSAAVILIWLGMMTGPLQAQTEVSNETYHLNIRVGLEGEMFNRQITWDDAGATSPLKSFFTLLRLEVEAAGGYTFCFLGGYSSSTYDRLIFRRLPFSIEFEGGGMGGTIFGGEFSKLFPLDFFGLGGFIRFLSSTGKEQKWSIPDLAVEGELKSTPSWKELAVGPVVNYTGFEYFTPFVSLHLNRLWGKFTMREIIENLTGEETKEIKGKALFGFSAGSSFILSSHLRLRGEATILPHKNGTDWSLNLRGILSF